MATKKKGTKAAKRPATRGKATGATFSKTIIVPEGTEHINIQFKIECKKGKCCCPKTIVFGISPIEPEGPDGDPPKKMKLAGASPIEPEGPDG
jgi:hypothetical protein